MSNQFNNPPVFSSDMDTDTEDDNIDELFKNLFPDLLDFNDIGASFHNSQALWFTEPTLPAASAQVNDARVRDSRSSSNNFDIEASAPNLSQVVSTKLTPGEILVPEVDASRKEVVGVGQIKELVAGPSHQQNQEVVNDAVEESVDGKGHRRQSATGDSSQTSSPPKRARRGEKKEKKYNKNAEDEDDPVERKKIEDAKNSKKIREEKKKIVLDLKEKVGELTEKVEELTQENEDLREKLYSERMTKGSSTSIKLVNNLDPNSKVSVSCITLNPERLPGAAENEQGISITAQFGFTSHAK